MLYRRPVILSFYGGGWCPYCNLELRAYQRVLGEIEAAGGQLVAVSPEQPDRTAITAAENNLSFPLLTDAGLVVARRFGIVFDLAQPLHALYTRFGHALPDVNGDDSWALPAPATFVIGRDQRIALASVDADYRQRLEPATKPSPRCEVSRDAWRPPSREPPNLLPCVASSTTWPRTMSAYGSALTAGRISMALAHKGLEVETVPWPVGTLRHRSAPAGRRRPCAHWRRLLHDPEETGASVPPTLSQATRPAYSTLDPRATLGLGTDGLVRGSIASYLFRALPRRKAWSHGTTASPRPNSARLRVATSVPSSRSATPAWLEEAFVNTHWSSFMVNHAARHAADPAYSDKYEGMHMTRDARGVLVVEMTTKGRCPRALRLHSSRTGPPGGYRRISTAR